MQPNFYVISLERDRLVATEIDCDEAAVALDAGQTLLLARPLDLVRVAVRHRVSLTAYGREPAGAAPSVPGHEVETSPRAAGPTCVVPSRLQGFWREWLASAPAARAAQPYAGSAVRPVTAASV